jgi:flagella basal body P-ring formation protein FlgA
MRTFLALLALLTMGAILAPVAARAQVEGGQSISGKTFERLAKHAIASIDVPGDEALIQASPVRDQIVGTGKVSLNVESPMITPSYVNVPIEITLDGAFVRTLFVGYRVQQYVRTAVAARDIVAGTVLTPGDVTIARVPSFGRLPNGTEVLVGRKVFSAFRKGQPIYIEATTTNQIVKPGTVVVLIVNDGGVSVVTEVQARTGGGLGDQVSVYNPQTNKMLSGTVIGPGRVELDIMGTQQVGVQQ